MPKSTTKASHEVMKASKSATDFTSSETTRRQQSLSNEIRRLSSLVKGQVNEFRQDGILTEKLERQAAHFTAITDPLAQSIDEGTSKGRQLADLQAKYEELAEQLRSKDVENERLREKVKNANNSDRLMPPGLCKFQKRKTEEKPVLSQCEGREPAPPFTTSRNANADDRTGQDVGVNQSGQSADGSLPTAEKHCRMMPGFTRLHEEIYPDPHANVRTNDMGAELRKWYEQLPKPKKRVDTVAYLIGQHEWAVSAIADLSKTPGCADEDDGKDASFEENADTEGHASFERGKALQQEAQDDNADGRVRPLKFSLRLPGKSSALSSSGSAGPSRSLAPPRPASSSSKNASSGDDSSHVPRKGTIIKQEPRTPTPAQGSHLLPPKPLARGRDSPWDPRHLNQQTLNTSAGSAITPRTKRPRSPSPERRPPKGPKRWIDSVCRPCLRTRSVCSGEVVCEACEVNGRRCEYNRCRDGRGCRYSRCRWVHPGMLDEIEGEWLLVDQ